MFHTVCLCLPLTFFPSLRMPNNEATLLIDDLRRQLAVNQSKIQGFDKEMKQKTNESSSVETRLTQQIEGLQLHVEELEALAAKQDDTIVSLRER